MMDRNSTPLRLTVALLLFGVVVSAGAAAMRESRAALVDSQSVGGNSFSTAAATATPTPLPTPTPTESPTPPPPATLYASADAYIDNALPDANTNGDQFLRVEPSGPSRALVAFDDAGIASAATGHTLVSATLRLYIETNDDGWGAGGNVDAHRVDVAWTEGGTTWNCPIDTDPGNGLTDCDPAWLGGTFESTPTASVVHTNGLTGWVEWDVTADVAAFLNATATNCGWLISKSDEVSGGLADYTSREGANPPELYLVFDN